MIHLKRLTPRPVKNTVKAFRINPIAGAPRTYRSRLARDRAAARSSTSTGRKRVAPPSPIQNDGGSPPPGRPDRIRGERRATRLRAQIDEASATKRDALRQRDKARETLSEVRGRLRKLEQQIKFPEEAWWAQRAELAGWTRGEGLRDFAYFPGGAQNPYLRMLYSRTPEAGFDPRPLARFDHLHRLPPDSVFHLHWTRIAQLGATTLEEAQAKSDNFLDTIASFVERGGTMLWSIHEPLPHDCPFPAVEQDLRQHLADLATGIHILHASTVDEVAPYYRLPTEKVFVVEHPLYTGIYEDYLPRASARRLIGLRDDEVMILGFGAIRPYKGFDRLVRLLPTIRERTGAKVRVMVAGPTMQSVDNSELERLVAATDGATLSEEPIPDQHVQVMFKSADIVALPYRQVLNSGVLMLGLTFAKPSIAPDNAVTRDALPSGLVRLFDRSDDDDLCRVLVEAVAEAGDSMPGLPESFATRYDPATIAGEFAAHLRRITDG
jgi:glycosyltransferase involved in cell wall biosynthesis